MTYDTKQSRTSVLRHTGGLEIVQVSHALRRFAPPRKGGLEKSGLKLQRLANVHRLTGGLER